VKVGEAGLPSPPGVCSFEGSSRNLSYLTPLMITMVRRGPRLKMIRKLKSFDGVFHVWSGWNLKLRWNNSTSGRRSCSVTALLSRNPQPEFHIVNLKESLVVSSFVLEGSTLMQKLQRKNKRDSLLPKVFLSR